jgi:hypothetical protein
VEYVGRGLCKNFCKDRLRHGVRRERIVQECLFRDDDIVAYSCQKPRLLHLPCSHVIVSCAESTVLYAPFVSNYFKKEAITSTWTKEVFRVEMFRPFPQNNKQVLYIPDPATKRDDPGYRSTRLICNMMDEAEAAKIEKCCSQCDNYGHTYNKNE